MATTRAFVKALAEPVGVHPQTTDSHLWNIIDDPEVKTLLDESVMSKTEAETLMSRFDTIRKLLNPERRYRQRLAELDHRKQTVKDYLTETGSEFVHDVHLADSLKGVIVQADAIMKAHSDEIVAQCDDEAQLVDTTFSAITSV